MTEHEDVAVVTVPRMERESRNASLRLQELILPSGGVARLKAIDGSFVLGDKQTAGRRVLSNKNRLFKCELRIRASQPIWRGRIGRSHYSRACPTDALECAWRR